MGRFAGLMLASVAALSLAVPAVSGNSAEDDIRSRLAAWTHAFNSGDVASACDLFSRTLVSDYRGQGEADYATRCALIEKALSDSARRFHYAADIKEVIVEGDLAVVRLTWTLTISPGDVKSVEPGMDVFRKEGDGKWRIVRYMAYEED
ncbi:YybH family protein [Ancylobacter sp.]|uniref:YybH family protein n=1 Tax=Ancylobacter sp. TaxID=1872567 RepID=UPI003D0D7D25